MLKRKLFFVFLALVIIGTTCQTATNAGQKVENTLQFASADIDMEGFELTHIEAVKHNMSMAGKQYMSIVVHLANYDRGERSYHPNPKEEGQRRVMVSFSAPSGEKLKPGVYSVDGAMAKDYRLSIGVEKKGKNIGLYNGTGTGEILSIDDKTITATVDVKDEKGTSVKAMFSTPWEKSRY